MEPLLKLADAALRSWEPRWTPFLGGAALEQAQHQLETLSELQVHSWGGHPGAERRRLLVAPAELTLAAEALTTPALAGVELLGNFLFDPAEPSDFEQALMTGGMPDGALGDLWLRGDRGAQAIALADAAAALDGQELMVRSVSVKVHQRPLDELQLPQPRKPRRLSSVEASLRLDAVGSAGFGVSRSRMSALIRQGAVRLNWQPVSSPSKELALGDRVQLQGRGELILERAELTAKQRWRVELLRQ
jgi:photosystem II S4 domain protein